MPNPKKRDSAYWLARLERDRPEIHARLLAGRFASVRAACAEAGLIRLPSRLDALKREWARASAAERETFLDWLKGTGSSASTISPPLSVPLILAGSDGRLLPQVVERIQAAMAQRGLRGPRRSNTGPIMTAMGLKPLDGRLGMALAGRWKPNEEFLDRLRQWLVAAEEE